MNILSIGDACLETVVRKHDAHTECERFPAKINDIVGGSGAIFAIEAKRYFQEVDLICKLAEDSNGQIVRDDMKRQGISVVLSENIPRTDRILYLHDSNGERVVLIDAPSAEYAIHLERFTPVKHYDVCHISGYIFQTQGQLQLLRDARNNGWLKDSLILLDMVPHDIYLTQTWEHVRAIAELADILIIELRSALRLLGIKNEGRDETCLIQEVDRVIGNQVRGLILRFGYKNCDKEWIRFQQICDSLQTGYRHTKTTRGFGDRLTVKFLQRFLKS